MSSNWTTSLPGFSGACPYCDFNLRTLWGRHGILLLVVALTFFLSACDMMSSSGSSSKPTQAASGPTIAPVTAPPGSDERPLQVGSLGRTTGADGLPTLQPPKGVNVSIDTLFSEDIQDPIERSKRVETAVIELRRDFDSTMPAIKRLVAVEKDIQLLTSQLQTLLNGEQPPPVEAAPVEEVTAEDVTPVPAVPDDTVMDVPETTPIAQTAPVKTAAATPPPTPPPPVQTAKPKPDQVQNAPPTAPHATAPPATAPPPASSPPVVATTAPTSNPGFAALGLRLGEYPDKTRVVFDLTGSVSLKTDLDNAEKILVVELAKATWTGPASQTLSSPVVQSYSTQPMDGGGTRVILILKQNTNIVYQSVLEPEGAGTHYRIVIDLSHG